MKKNSNYIFLFFLLMSMTAVNSYGQSDSTRLQVTYDVRYLNYEEDDSLSRDIARLDIGTYASRYYSLVLEWYKENPQGHDPYTGTRSRHEDVFKNMPELGQIAFIHMPYWLTTQDSVNLFNWQLMEGDSIVCEYPCKKAIVDYRGRTWMAWYTLDIPYSDGPWKLCGLPGLILYAQDNEGEFFFNCIGVEKGDGHSFSFPSYPKKQIVTPEKAEELLLLEAADNDSYVYMMSGARITARYDAKGHRYTWKSKTAVPYELFPKYHKQRKNTAY